MRSLLLWLLLGSSVGLAKPQKAKTPAKAPEKPKATEEEVRRLVEANLAEALQLCTPHQGRKDMTGTVTVFLVESGADGKVSDVKVEGVDTTVRDVRGGTPHADFVECITKQMQGEYNIAAPMGTVYAGVPSSVSKPFHWKAYPYPY